MLQAAPVLEALSVQAMKATICALIDNPGEVELAESWLEANRKVLSFVSEQNACGCCVMGWDIEIPEEFVSTLPNHISASSEWASS
ncbi:hypothetical protein [Pseudoalteromonas xiamenensis]